MIKAAAYCRVSTETEDQLNSLESQKRYFYDYISHNPLWELTKIYTDEGITGTSTKKRQAFHRMMKDAESHKFDLVLTKEISRFARNTLDSIYYTRRLKDLGIGIIFLNDNINTLDPDAELRLTILASIAQEESRKTSERVKWGQKRSMEQGVVFGRDMLGYDVREGRLYINKEGARTVKLIFRKFVEEGKGTHVIARELTEAGIPAMEGSVWHGAVILRILKNEKYCGDLVQKKTYTPDYLNHEKKYNRGEEDFVCLYSHHEPIISRELFDKAQAEIRRRKRSESERKKYSGRYCFSGLIRCGTCGCSYVARTKKQKDGSVYHYWRCYEGVQKGRVHTGITGDKSGCNNRTIKEEDLKAVLQYLMQNLKLDKQKIQEELGRSLKKVMRDKNPERELEKLRNKLKNNSLKKQGLIDLYLSQEITEEDYKVMKQKYEAEIEQLTKACEKFTPGPEEKTDFPGEGNNKDFTVEGNGFIWKILNGQEWNDVFYRNIIDQIIVEDPSVILVRLKNTDMDFKFILSEET